MPENRTFLLEIGTEEIPASYLEPAVTALTNDLKQSLKSEGVSTGEFKTLFTPRRIATMIEGVATKSKEKEEVRQGPPAKIAKDNKGDWTEAAKKFAQSQGVDESALFIRENEKGSYVCVQVKTGGEQTKDALSRILPNLLISIPFPRSMRWPQARGVTFARAVRWICCLFGNKVVEFEYAGLKASNKTHGHRFAHPEAITISNPEEYEGKLKEAKVIVDPEKRRKKIIAELEKAAKKLDCRIFRNDELLEEVVNLIEYPKAIVCSLGTLPSLPVEVLTTALAKHQRAFILIKDVDWIAPMPTPHFVVVTNSPKLDPKLSREWFERMAISRLEDAEFFFQEDSKKGLEAYAEEESRVEWVKGIGSLADKTHWLSELGIALGAKIKGFNQETYKRAAYLSKADLLSNLVREKEFTSLQGIAGYYYADRRGEKDEVCRVIFEQYGDTPTSLESAVFGIADRLLNICATFVAGKPPKGSSDPFALRRQAGAIMKIIIDHKLAVGLPAALERTLGLMNKKEKEKGQIVSFLTERLRLYLKDRGFAYDWVDAVLAVAGDEPHDSWLRLSAFRELDKGEEFRLVAVGQKRVANITRNTRNTPSPDPSLFDQKEESDLWEEANRIRPDLEAAVQSRDYKEALKLLLSIRPAIDRFFDEVFVMVDDEKLRINRLRLLAKVRDEFLRLADFSRMVVEGGEVA